MIHVEATEGCTRTPRVLMALEELGIAYELELRDPGFFAKTFNLAGPLFEDGALAMFEPNAVLRYLMRKHAPEGLIPKDVGEWAVADQWMDFAISALAPSAGRIAEHRQNVPADKQDRQMLEAESHAMLRALGALDAFLGPRPYLLGRFTLVDCTFAALSILPLTQIRTDHFSAVQDYAARLLARPSYQRAMARLEAGRVE
jgi:glutathione S-transferase